MRVMTVAAAIREAEALLPGVTAPDGERDVRWQAIIAVGRHIEAEPEAVWGFVARWGKSPSLDLRAAIACCLLEHLLEHHFSLLFPRVERLARKSKRFADTLSMAKFKRPKNALGRFG